MGEVWASAESDMPSYNHQWIWIEDTDHLLYSVDELMGKYDLSVDRNTNFLLGMVIDNRGLVPKADVTQVTVFGQEIKRRFRHKIAEVSGQGEILIIDLSQSTKIDRLAIMEEIAQGERVLKYSVEGFIDGK